jgi:poly-D-alanine transfer protein DltD
MSGNERVFTHKAVKEISVEKMEAQEPELVPALEQEQAQAQQEPIQQITPIVSPQENIIVDTSDVSSPSVKFNDYDQVYTPVIGGGGSTTLAYAPKEELGQEEETDDGDYGIDIIGDAVSVLSDFEELDF